MSKRVILILAVVWMVVLVAGVASSLTLSLCGITVGGEQDDSNQVVVSGQEYELIRKYERLEEILEIVQENYYKEVDEQTLLTGAMRGMLDSLEDPYTFYYTPEEMSESLEHQEGTYEGVGLQVLGMTNGDMVVTRTFKGSSASKEGICAGDRIVMVDGTPVSAETVQAMNEAVAMIKGENGTA